MKYTITYDNGAATNKTVAVTAESLEKAIQSLGFRPKQFILSRLVTYDVMPTVSVEEAQ